MNILNLIKFYLLNFFLYGIIIFKILELILNEYLLIVLYKKLLLLIYIIKSDVLKGLIFKMCIFLIILLFNKK